MSTIRKLLFLQFSVYLPSCDSSASATSVATNHSAPGSYLLIPTTQDEQRDLFILLRVRDEAKVSTILCSQVAIAGWHERLGSGGVADTLLDRMTANGYAITIGGDVSMRKRHSRI